MTMTPKEYADTGGTSCPVCDSVDIEGGSVQVDAGAAWQSCRCLDCDATWDDSYKLVGYMGLEENGD